MKTFDVDVVLGKVQVRAASANHVWVGIESDGMPITIHRVPYRFSVWLEKKENQPTSMRTYGEDWVESYLTLDRADGKWKVSPSDAAYIQLREIVAYVVEYWIPQNKAAMLDAEILHLREQKNLKQNEVIKLSAEISKLSDEIVDLQKRENDTYAELGKVLKQA
jgi:hypothetical protein